MTLQDGRKVIAFDFDGVLHDYHGWNGGILGEPMPGMYDLVTSLLAAGAHVVVHTTRDKATVQTWLVERWGMALDVFNEKWSRIDVFVDDRALRFTPDLVADRPARDRLLRELLDYQPHWRSPEAP